MAVKVKKAVLWKRDLENRPGTLAAALKPFADAKVNLQVVMGYAYPNERNRSALELYPVSAGKGESAAKSAGLAPMNQTSCLLVEGDDRVGLGYDMSSSLARAGVNISFAIIQVVGRKFLGIFGFDTDSAAAKGAEIIKSVGAAVKAAPKKKAKKAGARVAKKGVAKKKSAAKKTSARKKPAAKKSAAKAKKKPAAKKARGRK